MDLFEELKQATVPVPVEQKKLGCILLGGTGAGKTTLIGTAPKPLIFDFDHGLASLDSAGLQPGKDYYAVNFDKFDFKDIGTGDKQKRLMKVQANIEKILQTLCYAADRSGPFAPDGFMSDVETIALDSWTAMSRYFLYEIQVGLGQDYIKDKAGYDGYGQILKVFDNVAELIIQCKKHYHIVTTVLTKSVQRPGSMRDGDMIFVPDVDGSFKDSLFAKLDECYYLEAKPMGGQTKYLVHTQPTTTVPGLKSRSKLPAKLEGVTFPEVYKTYIESFEKNTKRD